MENLKEQKAESSGCEILDSRVLDSVNLDSINLDSGDLDSSMLASNGRFRRKSAAFSLIELVFVIAMIGILAAIAIPKLSATRTDALYAAINSDIQATISAIQVAALTQDISMQNLNGSFIMDSAGLSASRWVASGNGVRLGKNGAIDSVNNCVFIDINAQVLSVQIQPLPGSSLCQKLSNTYPKPLQISLSTSLF